MARNQGCLISRNEKLIFALELSCMFCISLGTLSMVLWWRWMCRRSRVQGACVPRFITRIGHSAHRSSLYFRVKFAISKKEETVQLLRQQMQVGISSQAAAFVTRALNSYSFSYSVVEWINESRTETANHKACDSDSWSERHDVGMEWRFKMIAWELLENHRRTLSAGDFQ